MARRDVLEAAGPAFIKWGQWAATRHDLFPPDFCTILEHLHTQARALGAPITDGSHLLFLCCLCHPEGEPWFDHPRSC